MSECGVENGSSSQNGKWSGGSAEDGDEWLSCPEDWALEIR